MCKYKYIIKPFFLKLLSSHKEYFTVSHKLILKVNTLLQLYVFYFIKDKYII